MTHAFRSINRSLQQWDHWLSQHHLGLSLLQAEKEIMSCFLSNHFGKQAVILGVPHQSVLFDSIKISQKALVTPLIYASKEHRVIESDLNKLSILTGSVDLVLLPHILDFYDSPQQLLSEACRIVKPEGLIVIAGFKPYSLWGLQKWLAKGQSVPWSKHYLDPQQVKHWLRLQDFVLEKQKSLFFRPPINYHPIYKKLHFIETVGSRLMPWCGSIYLLFARAKVIPLTPIKFKIKWKPALNPMPTSIGGHAMIHSNYLANH